MNERGNGAIVGDERFAPLIEFWESHAKFKMLQAGAEAAAGN